MSRAVLAVVVIILTCQCSTGSGDGAAPSPVDGEVGEDVVTSDTVLPGIDTDLVEATDTPPEADAAELCPEGTTRCTDDGDGVERCLSDGSWVALETCPGDATCVDGACVCEPCHVVTPSGCSPVGVGPCPEGWHDDGTCGCEPEIDVCTSGTMPTIGGGCLAVGPSCQDGWQASEDGFCRPPEGSCGATALPTVDGGCLPLGPSDGCGTSPWGVGAEDLPDKGVWFVLAGASAEEASGTKAHPYPTIGAALAMAQQGDTIMIGADDEGTTYDEGITLNETMTLVGRCSALVTITGHVDTPIGGQSAGIHVNKDAIGTSVSRLTIANDGTALVISGTTEITVTDVAIVGCLGNGIYMSMSTEVALSRVLVSSPLPGSGSDFGWGIYLSACDDITMEQVLVEGAEGFGVFVMDSSLDAHGIEVKDMQLDSMTFSSGRCISINQDSSLTMDTFRLSSCSAAGIDADQSSISLTDGRITATASDGTPSGQGHGVFLDEASELTMDRVVIHEATSVGLGVYGGSVATLSDVVVANTHALDSGIMGRGIDVVDSELHATGLLLDTTRDMALHVWGGSLELDHAAITGTLPHELDGSGFGIVLEEGSTATVGSVLVEDSLGTGIVVSASSIDLLSSVVRGSVMSLSGFPFGYGIRIKVASSATITDCIFMDNHATSILASGESTVSIQGSASLGAGPSSRPKIPRGIEINDSPDASITATAVIGHEEVGIYSARSFVTIDGVTIREISPTEADEWGCGLQVLDAESVIISALAVHDTFQYGVYLRGTHVEVSSSVVSDTASTMEDKFVMGLAVLNTPDASIDACLVEDSTEYGLVSFSSTLALTNSTITATHPSPSGQGGHGLYGWLGSITIDGCRIYDNHVHAISFLDVDGAITDSLVSQTYPGISYWISGSGVSAIEGIGDGIAVMHRIGGEDGTVVDITGTTVLSSARAGIIYDGALGSIHDNLLIGNLYGYAIQGDSPVEPKDNTLIDNQEDQASGYLVIDDAPKAIPGF